MYKFYGLLVYYIIMLIKLTLKIEIIGKENMSKDKPYVIGSLAQQSSCYSFGFRIY